MCDKHKNMTEDKVQLHVDVPRPLWKAMKQAALDGGDTLKGIVEKALDKRFTPVKPVVSEKVERVSPISDKCSRCEDWFPVNTLKTEPKTGKLFCPDCVENMKQ